MGRAPASKYWELSLDAQNPGRAPSRRTYTGTSTVGWDGGRDRRTGSSWAREHGVWTRNYLKQGERKRPTPNISSELHLKALLAHGRHAHTKMSNPVTIEITYQ